ncbi:YqiA/YcfP family alpha/beta fold hydrolase [Microbulbifer sediminum]|uniref:YqiA/YcfP family alpha/beta fold hydrolase n=1 Tax=Microbulbifer sediminum TaxID=2904250 RepID=UPI001F34767E
MRYLFYLHGFRSLPGKSAKVETLRSALPGIEVVGLDYQPHHPAIAAATLKRVVEEHGADNIVAFAGTSFGGFWSRWAACRFGVPGVAINPSMRPWQSLQPGTYGVYGSDETITVSPEDLEATRDYAVKDTGKLVTHVLAMDDEVLDSTRTLEMLRGHCDIEPILFEDGGHRFSRFDELAGLFQRIAG